MSTSYLLHCWKTRGIFDASPFVLVLGSQNAAKYHDQSLIIKEFNDLMLLPSVWFQLTDCLHTIKRLAEASDFAESKSAWLLLSKIAYFRGHYSEAVRYALAAGDAFSIEAHANAPFIEHMYTQKVVEEALDRYKALRCGTSFPSTSLADDVLSSIAETDLEKLVNNVMQRALLANNYESVLGLALETNRIDMVKLVLEHVKQRAATKDDVSHKESGHSEVELLMTTLQWIERMLHGQPHYETILSSYSEILFSLDLEKKYSLLKAFAIMEKDAEIARLLLWHIQNENKTAIAFQFSFMLVDSTTQKFRDKVIQNLMAAQKSDEQQNQISESVYSILKGNETTRFYHQFLVMRNQTDFSIIGRIRDAVRNACTHNAALIANGLMHVGTTSDVFLRENLSWISTATNWNKFNAVASLGLIHKGNEANAKKVLEPYLPKESEQDMFKFKEGGALYAYGLIHANHVGDGNAIEFLMNQISGANTAPLRHGVSLGLGLAALGTNDKEIYAKLRDILYLDEAVAGEAAALAMGMVMAASMDVEAFNEMRQFMQDSRHDKIQRGLQIGLSMLAYGKRDLAKDWIDTLLSFKSNAVMRQAGIWMTAMAYVGTGDATVAQLLLEKLATDSNQDMKRFAGIALGFVLCNHTEQCLKYTAMLIEHFNGNIRYGAAVAVGITCAGTGNKEALTQLEPLLTAKENYVRQGALIAMSFILTQKTAPLCPKVRDFRETLCKMQVGKGEDSITKFGATIAQGILDAGGRNVTVSLFNRYGRLDMPSVLGTLMFLQHWYWHSLVHTISLAFHPTCLIGVNKHLLMPKMEFKCNMKASIFKYPSAFEHKKEEMEKVETAILSTTRKLAAMRAAALNAEKKEKGEADTPIAELKELELEKEKPAEPEPTFHMLANPARVTDGQQAYSMQMPDSSRYKPLRPLHLGGIVLLEDIEDGKDEDIVEVEELSNTSLDSDNSSKGEADKPTPFEIDLSVYD